MTEENLDQNAEYRQPTDRVRPIILTLKKKKKKRSKKRYSKGLEEVQRMERQLTRSTQRLTRAADKGITTYRKLSIKSAEKKKDGAVLDFIPNTGIAMSRSMREASTIP